MGLISAVVSGPDDVVTAALEYARDMARHCAPTSLAMLRHQLQADAQSDFATALAAAYRAMNAAVEGAAFREGLDSFVEGRPPVFPGAAERLPSRAHHRPAAARGRPRPSEVWAGEPSVRLALLLIASTASQWASAIQSLANASAAVGFEIVMRAPESPPR